MGVARQTNQAIGARLPYGVEQALVVATPHSCYRRKVCYQRKARQALRGPVNVEHRTSECLLRIPINDATFVARKRRGRRRAVRLIQHTGPRSAYSAFL